MMLVKNEAGEIIERKDIQVKALLTILISQTLDFFSIGKTMSDTQVAMTIDMILEDYSTYKPDYFILCFKRARKGQYGIAFDRIDGQIIFEWLAKFDAEYTAEIEQERLLEHKRMQRDIYLTPQEIEKNNPVPMPDYIKEDYVKAIIKPVVVSEKPALTTEQLIVKGFRDDFDRICEANGSKGDLFIHFYGTPGKSMTFQEYLEYRFLLLEHPHYYNQRF